MKQVHWQIPFGSRSTNYRIDIYADGECAQPEQLTAGNVPFRTDEDRNTKHFTAVRAQTGNLTIVDTDGHLLERLAPHDDIDHPLILINLNTNTVEWQGFLSCRVYTQQYTDRPQQLTFAVNSVLSAMGSVEMDVREDMLFNTIMAHITYAFQSISDKSGMDMVRLLYMPENEWRFYSLFINSYFYTEDVISGEKVQVETHSKTCLSLINAIAGMFGCVVREQGDCIYFQRINVYEATDVPGYRFSDLVDGLTTGCRSVQPDNYIQPATINIADLQWGGEDHKVDIVQGARRVRIGAKLQKWNFRTILPDTPYTWLQVNPSARWAAWREAYVNTNSTFHSQMHFRGIRTQMEVKQASGGLTYEIKYLGIDTLPAYYTHSILWTDNEYRSNYDALVRMQTKAGTVSTYQSSFLTRFRDRNTNQLQPALFIAGIPYELPYGDRQFRHLTKYANTPDNYVFMMETALPFAAKEGWINFNAHIADYLFNDPLGTDTRISDYIAPPRIIIALRFGNKWWSDDAGDWVDTFTSFNSNFDLNGNKTTNKTDDIKTDIDGGWFFPIKTRMTGKVALYIYGQTKMFSGEGEPVFDVMFDDIVVQYAAPNNELKSDRTDNGYITDTGAHFRDEENIELELVSDAANDISENMLYDSVGDPIQFADPDRPELLLLAKAKEQYSAARHILTLQCKDAQPSTQLLTITGYRDDTYPSGRSRNYLPLSVSHNWAADTASVQCFEIPE